MKLSKNQQLFVLILLAYLFSIAVRLILVYQFSDMEQFKFNNQFMINTNDGYWYAEGARDILSGDMNRHDMSAFDSAGSILTAFLAKILPFSFETIIFYMPAFFASLIVIPIVLIGKMLGRVEVGFIAALFGSIAWSYYNRTMVGYYDTDLLNIVFPTFLLWSLMWAISTQENKYFIFTGLEIVAYRWWYPQSYALEFSFFGLILGYAVYLYVKQDSLKKDSMETIKYLLALLTFMMFAMINIDSLLRIIILGVLFFVLSYKKELFFKYIYHLLSLALLAFLLTGGVTPIVELLERYIFSTDITTIKENLTLNFYTVGQTIREAGKIPFETFANRISGHTITFFLSLVGYLYLVIKKPVSLLGIPMIGLGFLAYSGGLRFTVYAVPVLALGLAFLIVEVSKIISDKNSKSFYYGSLAILTIAMLLPNIQHVIAYKVPTVFNNKEVKVLETLKTKTSRKDYVVGWWDYGYPIRYYANVRTLSDGNKHSGDVNFPSSFILTHPQNEAAKMLRLDVEYTEKRFEIYEENRDKKEEEQIKWQSSNIGQMTLDYGFKNTNDFLSSLKKEIKLPKKTRDVYLYLPNRMMNIYPTVTLFSNINLMTGKQGKQPFFYRSTNYQLRNGTVYLGRGITLDTRTNTLHLGKQETVLKSFTKTFYDKNGVLKKQVQNINPYGKYHVIYMSNYGQFLIMDDKTYNSTYFQLFVLENYDHDLFEPTILSPLVKVYKLKL
jgi:dolichyl-diphosphooligosaccharide--protein glycosyltransferase/undecaprenyl-diphosphooligosaccharide--protein glycosyltransferase